MTRAAVALMLVLAAVPAAAQDRPFLFSIATTGAETRGANVHFDIGTGEREFVFEGEQAIEQRIGLQAALGRGFTFVASASVAQGSGAVESGQGAGSAEALFDLLRGPDRRTTLALGGGIGHEYLGTNVARIRVAAGHNFGTSLLQANVLFDKPMADNRDAIDLITTVGWMQKLNGSLSLGVEAIGEDLEGFWESDEAEGGARLLLGPSLHIGGTSRKWRLTVGGGPVYHATTSTYTSDASRTLPRSARGTGYAVQTSFSYLF